MEQILFDFLSQYVILSDAEKNAILDLDIFRSYHKGTVLLEEGQFSKEGYFVLKGIIRKYYHVDGDFKTTAFYTELEGFTPHCVVGQSASEYYVDCIEDCILTVATPEMETEIFEKFPKFETLCRLLSEELLAKQQFDFDDFKLRSPENRYLNLLNNRPDLLQRVPQNFLASFIGIKPQSLSRLKARIVVKTKSR
jgi:hypothetical protein